MTCDVLLPTRDAVSMTSRDVDEAQQIGGALYYPHEVSVLGERREFSMHIDATQLGPVTVGWISYDTEVQIGTGPLTSAYQVNIPLHGELKTGSGVDRMIATPSRAAVYRCDRATVISGWRERQCRMLAVKVTRSELEDHLASLLGRPVDGPVHFALPMDLTERRAEQWWLLLRDLASQLRDPQALCRHPLMAESLSRSVMTGLLLAARHDYSEELDSDVGPPRPATIQRAVDYIEDHLSDPLDVAMIAAHVRLSVRSLQQGFQNSMGTTPMRYLRDARLRRVRRDLLAADPSVGVAQIAFRWGFSHLGRFAGQYRQAFGESPSEALHAAATQSATRSGSRRGSLTFSSN